MRPSPRSSRSGGRRSGQGRAEPSAPGSLPAAPTGRGRRGENRRDRLARLADCGPRATLRTGAASPYSPPSDDFAVAVVRCVSEAGPGMGEARDARRPPGSSDVGAWSPAGSRAASGWGWSGVAGLDLGTRWMSTQRRRCPAVMQTASTGLRGTGCGSGRLGLAATAGRRADMASTRIRGNPAHARGRLLHLALRQGFLVAGCRRAGGSG